MQYFDNAATTKAYGPVVETINKYLLEDFYNPSALYKKGMEVEKDIEEARKTVSSKLGVSPAEIYFTPGGTWSNNIVLNSVLGKNSSGLVISSKLEHSSVFKAMENFAGNRDIVYLAIDEYGRVDLGQLEKLVEEENIDLVSLMQVNNELGTINPIEEIGSILKKKDIPFHVDGIQGFCKYDLDLKKAGVDFYSLSGHKINGPKGVGALYISDDYRLNPLNFGGGQEKGLVSGTENVPGIMGLAKAVEIKKEKQEDDYKKVKEINSYLREELAKIEDSRINSPEDASVYILNIAFKGIKSEVLIHMLSDQGFLVSAGSACSKNKKSRVMDAIGLNEDYSSGAIRISFSYENTMEDAQALAKALEENVKMLRQIIGS